MSQPSNSTTDVSSEDLVSSRARDSIPDRIGVISDVHGNLIALQAVLEAMPAVDAIVHAGDTVGYGPQPDACVTRLREHDVYAVQGNHDMTMFTERTYESGGAHAKEVLSDRNRAWLQSLPTCRRLWNNRVRVTHGHPEDPHQYTFPESFASDLLDGEDILVLGHTHIQAAEQFDGGWVLNPGSVGQPRDGDPRAAYATVDLADGTVSLHRVAYDIDAVVEQIRARSISDHNATRLYDGR